jgi:hypothetical protein
MDSQPERPDAGHPYPTYADLQTELAWHREQLNAVRAGLPAIEVGLRTIRQQLEEGGALDLNVVEANKRVRKAAIAVGRLLDSPQCGATLDELTAVLGILQGEDR